jgi:integrase
MPFVSWDTQKGRAVFNRRFPVDVQPITGLWFRHKYPASVSRRDADEMSAEQLVVFNAAVDEARAIMGTALGIAAQSRAIANRVRAIADHPEMAALAERMRARSEAQELRILRQRLADDAPDAPVDPEAVIELWIKDRKRKPKARAIRARRSKMEKFFAWLDAGHTDMTRVIVGDIQRYKEYLPEDIARDHLTDILSHFNTAAKNNKLPRGNPAKSIGLPAKRQKSERVPFTPVEQTSILNAARDADPVIKWSNWLAAFTGAGTAEIIDADTRDVEIVDGIPTFHIRGDYRTHKGDDLKNAYRERSLPIRSIFAEEFVAYARSLGPGPLFPQIAPDRDGIRSHRASPRIIRFIRRLGIEAAPGEKKDFYSWRTTTTTKLENLTTYDRARYIVGHTAGDVHAKHYLKHPLAELCAVIEQLPDPTA